MDPLKYIVPGRKRLPYGMMNFADIRQDNYYYVDKTRFIPMIEEADRFFFFIAALLSRTSARYTPTSFRKILWKDCVR